VVRGRSYDTRWRGPTLRRYSCLLLGVLAAGCEVVQGTELEAIKKLRTGQYELVKTDELAQLRQDASLGKSVGRYHQYNSGGRTWRLDTATGKTCLLLASEADWKKPDVAAQNCLLEQ
jgi:hypothetical protein